MAIDTRDYLLNTAIAHLIEDKNVKIDSLDRDGKAFCVKYDTKPILIIDSNEMCVRFLADSSEMWDVVNQTPALSELVDYFFNPESGYRLN